MEKNIACKNKPVYSSWVKGSIDGMRIDAMRIYLEKNNWLEEDIFLNVFNIVKFKENFSQTENLTFEQAIEAVKIYEKIDSTLKQNQ